MTKIENHPLIVDEVLAVGDAEFQKRAIGKMQEVSQGQGRTVLFVSHNMGSIKSLCKRSILLENGTIAFDGETNECINTYLTKSKEEIGSKLSSIKNRNGNGKLRFADYKFRNKDNEIITEVISGEYLKIEIDFDLGTSNLIFNSSDFIADTWSTLEIPITLSNKDGLGLLIYENVNGSSLSNFYLDNIYFY